MIVSILQLMGFPLGRGVPAPVEHGNQGITRSDEVACPGNKNRSDGVPRREHAVAAAGRRQDVKLQTKSAPKAKAPPVKTGKPAAKAPAKKVPAKAAAKHATKASVKAAVKAAVAQPAAKQPAAAVKSPAVKAAKPAVTKAAAPVSAKPAGATKAPAAARPQPSAAAKAPAQASSPSSPVAAAPAPVRAMPPRPDVAASPTRSVKPSARLAQITVPSMAQSVASTAAKASYTQTPTPPVLTPPPLVAVKKDPKLANNWKTKPAEQLTDAEVLAMPDAEYMNDKQMAFFRNKLVQLKRDILNNAGETTEHLREDTVIVPDPADRATIEEEHALELRTRDRERKLLKKIEQSIARIDAGDYGYCDETGEPIGVGRLLARPTATLSLEAQQRRELKQKMFGD